MDLLKIVHLGFVGLSFAGFLLRGFWMMIESPLLQAKLTKILPHIIDTVLLGSAIALAVKFGLNPAEQPWLLAKIIALFVYIGLGMVALKAGRSMPVRVSAFLLAVVCFVYIVAVAATKSPAGLFAFF